MKQTRGMKEGGSWKTRGPSHPLPVIRGHSDSDDRRRERVERRNTGENAGRRSIRLPSAVQSCRGSRKSQCHFIRGRRGEDRGAGIADAAMFLPYMARRAAEADEGNRPGCQQEWRGGKSQKYRMKGVRGPRRHPMSTLCPRIAARSRVFC